MKIGISSNGQRRNARWAFSLVEVMVAVSIIMITFLTIFGGMTMGLSVTQLSRENLRATQIMLDKMEGVRLYSWTQLNDTNFLRASFTNWFFETNNIGQASASGDGALYTGTVVVAPWPYTTPSYSPNVRQVTVTVNWQSGSVQRSRTMSTFVSMMGTQNYIFNK